MVSDSKFTSLQRRRFSRWENGGGGPMEGSWAQTETLEGYYRVNETAFTEYVTGEEKGRGYQRDGLRDRFKS